MRKWHDVIRTWLLVEAFRRAYDGHTLDANIRSVANRLTLAREKGGGWQAIIHALTTSGDSFDSFRRTLIFRAVESKERDFSEPPKRKSRNDFFNKVIYIAEGKEARETLPGDEGVTGLISDDVPLHLVRPKPTVPVEAFPSLDEDDAEDVHGVVRLEGEDPDDDLFGIPVDPERPYLHHRQKSHSILTLTGEHLHYLPWSWHSINPYELAELERWVDGNLNASPESPQALLAAIVWIALNTGRTLLRALRIPIAETLSDEWILSRKDCVLRRKRPARTSAWKPKTDQEKSWILPAAPHLTLTPPGAVRQVLDCALSTHPEAVRLSELWPEDADIVAPKSMFTRQMTGTLSRITSSMLASVLPLRAFQNRENATFTRLVAAHPNSGLPASCAYSAWSNEDAEMVLNPERTASDEERLYTPGSSIGMGSLLLAVESHLKKDIAQAHVQLAKAELAGDLLLTHNRYTALLVEALFAATGGRTVRDPFESPRHFDFTNDFVFIDDKASGQLRQGRIFPLANSLARHLDEEYFPYLERLVNALGSKHRALADDIQSLLGDSTQYRMPLFFFLTQNPELRWSSVSESAINALNLFHSPLPLRLYRHRLPNRLRIKGGDPEVIEAILGHAEAGAASYGDDSPRCWRNDMEQIRSLLDQCFNELGFKLHAPKTLKLDKDYPALPSDTKEQALFGANARARDRRKRRRNLMREAKNQINHFLAGRSFSELQPEELQQLSEELLGISEGRASSEGYLKYAYLQSRIDQVWKKKSKWLRSRMSYRQADTAASPFTLLSTQAIGAQHELQEILHGILGRRAVANIPLGECRLLSVALLCVEVKIASSPLLESVLEVRDFRLSYLEGQYFLEYAPNLTERLDNGQMDITVQRFQIPPKVAQLLDRIGSADRVRSLLDEPTPDKLSRIWKALEKTGVINGQTRSHRQLIKALCQVMDQFVAMNRPGQVAAMLSGRRISVSLDWNDRIRRDENRILVVKDASEPEADPETADELKNRFDLALGRSSTAVRHPETKEERVLMDSARRFFSNLRSQLRIDGELPQKYTPLQRKTIKSQLNRVLRNGTGTVSGAVYLYGQWMLQLLTQEKKKGKLLSPSSISRYFTALSPVMQELACNVDILSLDGDELTDFYGQLLLARPKLANKQIVEETLKRFHAWARNLGVAEPDWEELALSSSYWSVRPTFFTEQDYLYALDALLSAKEDNAPRALQAAFLLLLCYRFALRPKEALGLLRNDWCQWGDEINILVRKNYLRDLKRPQSRRQIPLLFELSHREKTLIEKILGLSEATHGDDMRAPLFADTDTPRSVGTQTELKLMAAQALQLVTTNAKMVLYSARHSCAAEVCRALYGLGPTGRLSSSSSNDHWRDERIRTTLLGNSEVATRRTAWALARFMGHAGPLTAPKNYLHFFTEWADTFHTWEHEDYQSPWGTIRNLDVESRSNRVRPLFSSRQHQYQPLTTVIALKLMRLIARGIGLERASTVLSLKIEQVHESASLICKVGEKLRLAKLTREVAQTDGYEYLRRLSEGAWSRLITLASMAEKTERSVEPLVTVDELPSLIGPTRQLLLWEPYHFAWARQLLSAYDLPREQYVVIPGGGSSDIRKMMEAMAAEHGFLPDPPTWEQTRAANPQQPGSPSPQQNRAKSVTRTLKRPRLDVAEEIVRGRPRKVPERWGIAWKESATAEVRSGIEWMVLVVATALGAHASVLDKQETGKDGHH